MPSGLKSREAKISAGQGGGGGGIKKLIGGLISMYTGIPAVGGGEAAVMGGQMAEGQALGAADATVNSSALASLQPPAKPKFWQSVGRTMMGGDPVGEYMNAQNSYNMARMGMLNDREIEALRAQNRLAEQRQQQEFQKDQYDRTRSDAMGDRDTDYERAQREKLAEHARAQELARHNAIIEAVKAQGTIPTEEFQNLAINSQRPYVGDITKTGAEKIISGNRVAVSNDNAKGFQNNADVALSSRISGVINANTGLVDQALLANIIAPTTGLKNEQSKGDLMNRQAEHLKRLTLSPGTISMPLDAINSGALGGYSIFNPGDMGTMDGPSGPMLFTPRGGKVFEISQQDLDKLEGTNNPAVVTPPSVTTPSPSPNFIEWMKKQNRY